MQIKIFFLEIDQLLLLNAALISSILQ